MKSWLYVILAAALGAAAGLLYYHFFGCNGTCPITSDPWRTAVWFSLVGGLLGLAFSPEKKS